MPLPSLEDFAVATQAVLADLEVGDYPPTYVFETDMVSLEALAADADPRETLQDQASLAGWGQLEFLFGVPTRDGSLMLGHYDVGELRFLELVPVEGGYEPRPAARPTWWWLEP